MRFTLGRVVHYYYITAFIVTVMAFSYGVHYYWNSGLLNVDYVSNLYDGTSRVKTVKERNDIEEVKKYADGDRIKEANKIFSRLETDIIDLKSIKTTDPSGQLEENLRQVKSALVNFQSAPELSSILTGLQQKVSSFEAFVIEKKWPTLSRMSTNLRIKINPSRLVVGGLYNFERTQNLSQSVNNDLEAMTNFTTASGLPVEIKNAILNRIKTLKNEAQALNTYIEEHKKFNRLYVEFAKNYALWFKAVEPEIAFKKIQFEKSTQTIFYSIIFSFTGLVLAIGFGIILYNYTKKKDSEQTEAFILETIKERLLPVDNKPSDKFSLNFAVEFDKCRDYVHKRMTFGSIFQEAVPFPAILLDSNLNLMWGNDLFYKEWQLKNFKNDDDTLSWDFLQRFTDLADNSSILSALRMSAFGAYKIQVKTHSMAEAVPYQMYVSPVEYANQKRIMILFYPLSEESQKIELQKNIMTAPITQLIYQQLNEKLTPEEKNTLREDAQRAGSSEIFSAVNQLIESSEHIKDELNNEIEELEAEADKNRKILSTIRSSLVSSYETQRSSVNKYNTFKQAVSAVIDSRDQIEEQFKFAMNSSRELLKDQNKILTIAEKADKSVDDYIKSLKTISDLKADFKELKQSVDDFKGRIQQNLDQLLVFSGQETDSSRVDQFIGKVKIEMKGFDKVLSSFSEVVTQLDVTVTKINMMVETREKADIDSIRYRVESLKNTLENIQFSSNKVSSTSHLKDEEMIESLKVLIKDLKTEMKRVSEMCHVTGMSQEHLQVISPSV